MRGSLGRTLFLVYCTGPALGPLCTYSADWIGWQCYSVWKYSWEGPVCKRLTTASLCVMRGRSRFWFPVQALQARPRSARILLAGAGGCCSCFDVCLIGVQSASTLLRCLLGSSLHCTPGFGLLYSQALQASRPGFALHVFYWLEPVAVLIL